MLKKRYWLKLSVNITIIALEILTIYSAYMLFAHKWEPLQSVLTLLGTTTLLYFSWKLGNQRWSRWQRPGLMKTTLVVLAVAVLCTFAGIEPMSTFKDNLFTGWEARQTEWKEATEKAQQEKEAAAQSQELKLTLEETTPQGTYTESMFGTTVIFEGNKVTTLSFLGKEVFEYKITTQGDAILATNVITNKEERWSYKYIKEEDCVVLDNVPFWGQNPRTEGKTAEVSNIERDERKTLNLINQERNKVGLPSISWSDNLHNGARNWSEHLQFEGELYHDTSGYFAGCCYGASWSSYQTPQETVEAWMTSSGHRAILLGRYRVGAVGIATDNGYFATYRCQ